jgi:hypothetical protein
LRSIGLALTVVLALIGAPAVSAVRNECNLCPRTCPMHRHAGEPKESTPRLKCHGASGGGHHGAEQEPHAEGTTQHHGPTLARAACGNHSIMPATALPPMILPAALARTFVPVIEPASLRDPTWRGRLADPPDTPPPIAAA